MAIKFLQSVDVGGEVQGTSLDINGNADIAGNLTVGVDDTGHDVIFYGATSGKHMHWDENSNGGRLNLNGGADLYINQGHLHMSQGSFYFKNASTGTQRHGFVADGQYAFENVDLRIQATKKLYLDGGSSTYIRESADGIIQFVRNGSVGFRIESAGVFSSGNLYSSDTGQFRNYGGTWKASTGVSGNGFQFVSADATALTLSSTGDATFAGNVTAGSNSLTAGSLDINGNADISGNLTVGGSLIGTANHANNLNATDDRDMAPEDYGYTNDLRIFFSTKEGLEVGSGSGSNYQDVLYLNSYSDATGGDANILAFDKSEMKIYHYQADQAATNWGTPKELVYTANPTFTGTVTLPNSNTLTGSSGKVAFNGRVSGSTPTGTTDFTTKAYVDLQITNLIDSSPGALNTLNELADALGDDANFSTTVTNSIATKLPLAGGTMTGQLLINHDNGLRLGDTANASTSRTTLTSFPSGGNSRMKIKGGNFVHDVTFETSWNNFEYAELVSSYNTSDTTWKLHKSASDGSTAATTTISTGTSTFAGDIDLGANHIGRDGDNYIGFESDNLIKFRVNGATQVKISDGVLSPQTDSDVDLGTNSVRFANIYGDTLYGDGSNLTNISATDSTKLPLSGGTLTGGITMGADTNMNGHSIFETSENFYSIDLKDHSDYTWLRNVPGVWTFQRGTGGDNWTYSFQLTLPDHGTTANAVFAELGQKTSNASDGRYKGVRIVKYESSALADGDLKAAEVIATSLDVNGNADISGTLNLHDEILSTASGSLLELYRSSWSNATNHDILYYSWNANTDDFVYLKSPGNSTNNHGIAFIGDNVIALGRTNVEAGNPELTSAAAPLNDNWLVLNSSSATFAGTIDSGAITSTGKIQSSAAEAQLEVASSHGRTTTLQQGGGHFHISADHVSGVAINYGKTNEGLLRLYNNTAAAITLDATGGTITSSGKITGTELEGTSLDINGNGDISGSLTLGGDVTIINSIIHAGNTDTYFGFHDTDQWRVVTDGTERFEITNSGSTFSGDVQAAGLYVGATNTSFDFYNNGTSYLNGATTVDDNLTVNGNLDLNGNADISGNAVFHGNTGFGGTGSYRVHAIGTGWAGNGVAIQSTTTNGAVLTLVNTAKNFQIASRGSTLDFRDVSDNDTRRFFVDSTGNLQPGADSSYTLGTNGNRWSNVFADTSTATTFSGDLNGTINTATTAATQSAGNNSTKVATTAYVDTAVSNLIDGAPGALDTLNELAEALNDDDDAVVTLTNSITANTNNITSNNTIANAALPKAGGTMSGAIAMGNNNITGINSLQANGDVTILTSTGEYSIYGAANGQTALYTNGVKKFETTTTGVDITGGTVGMPSGGILNFNSGDVTVTHSSNKLTFDGASAIQINTPASNSTSQNLILNRPAAGTHYSSIEWHTNGTVDWAIGQNSADNFEIFENGADATTRLTIKEGGNVGVGVTNPTSKLHVDGNIAVTGTVDGVDISSLPTSFFDGAYGSLSGAPTTISNAQATKLGYIVVTSGVDLDEISSLAEGAVQLSQTQTISGTKTFSAATGFTNTTNSTSKTTGAVKLSGGMGIAKTLNVGEDVVAYASSDKRYKDNLQVITNPIDKVKSLTGYTFTWNDKHEQFNGNNDIGVVAQEVEKVFPEIVDTRDNGYKAVKYEKMVAVLIEAVKDQQKQIDELKAIIDGSSK